MVPKTRSLRNLSIKENPTKVLTSEFDKRDKFSQLMGIERECFQLGSFRVAWEKVN